MPSSSELQCVAGEYISPVATSVPSLEPVPALPVEFVPLRGFFSFFDFCQPRLILRALRFFVVINKRAYRRESRRIPG